MDLKEGTIYLIRHKHNDDKKRVFTGIFKRFVKDAYCNKMNAEFINVTCYYKKSTSDLTFWNYTDYNYYDVCKMNNAKKARHDMEKRALDMILKRLVNEYFEWL